MARKKVVPKGKWLVARTRSKETVSLGGLVLPAVADAQDEGIVLAVGPECKNAQVGDVIIFTQCRTTRKGGEDVYLIEDDHVIAAIQDGPEV